MANFLLERKSRLLTTLLLGFSLLLAACGDSSTATLVPASATSAATVAVASPTPGPVATATPVQIVTATSIPVPTGTTVRPTNAAATTQPPVTATAAPLAEATRTEILPFAADKAYAHVKVLAGDIGIRAAGSENQKKAASYIAQQFEAVGLKADFQESRYNWQRDTGSTLTVGNAAPLKIRLLNVSGDTATKLDGELINVEDTNVDPATLTGKIILINAAGRNLNPFIQKLVGLAEASRPVAVLIIPAEPEPLRSPNLRKAPINLAYIDQATGQALTQKVGPTGSLKVSLNLSFEKSDITVRNVIGTRPASSQNAPVIIIGGHYDSVPEGPGANDNGSGTGITIELARVLAKAYPAVELRFVAFDAEELGLIGSRDYVSKLTDDDKSRIQAMFNIDMVTTGQSLTVAGSQKLAGLAKGVALDAGMRDVQVQATERDGGGSDHASFAQAKIPFLFFNRQSDPNYHRSSDTIDKFNTEPLDQVGKIMLGTLQRFFS